MHGSHIATWVTWQELWNRFYLSKDKQSKTNNNRILYARKLLGNFYYLRIMSMLSRKQASFVKHSWEVSFQLHIRKTVHPKEEIWVDGPWERLGLHRWQAKELSTSVLSVGLQKEVHCHFLHMRAKWESGDSPQGHQNNSPYMIWYSMLFNDRQITDAVWHLACGALSQQPPRV